MHQKNIRLPLLIGMLALCLLIGGCATVPPQPITGLAPTTTSSPSPSTGDAGEAETETGNGEAASPGATAGQAQAAAPSGPAVAPTQVELFYSGMPSMMGFADAAQSTVYEQTMEALPAVVSLLWPSANASYLRYGANIAKDDMRLGKEQLLENIGSPSFYRDTALTETPARLKIEGQPLVTEQENLNEPVQSFYEAAGRDTPARVSPASGTPVAVNASDAASTSLTLIVTDLHELRMDDGALLTALNDRCLAVGRTIGVAAILSEFAGYIPDIGPNGTTFVWGAPPTGTLDYVLDYTEYRVGISIDPEQRAMAQRPFYVLVIGDQSAVNAYLAALEERLTREFTGSATYQFKTAVYGSGYVPEGYTLAGNMRYAAGQGVTAVPEQNAPAGVNLIELKASQQARYLEWQVEYRVHPSDPRGMNLTEQDFHFVAQAVSDGSMQVLSGLSWQVLSAQNDTVTLALRLDLPQGVLPQGQYTLGISGSLTGPDTLPGTDWLQSFGYDADGTQLYDMEQNTAQFDGGRTLYLSRLIDTLGRANMGRLAEAPLGTVQIALTVYA